MDIRTLKAKTKEVFSVSELMINRTPITFDEVMEQYPNYVTVKAVDLTQMNSKYSNEREERAVFLFKELPLNFMIANGVPLDYAKTWISLVGGDISELNKTLQDSLDTDDSMRVRLIKPVSKTSGNSYKSFEVLE